MKTTPLILIIVFLHAGMAFGQKRFPNTTGDGNWHTAGNWNPSGVPTSATDVGISGAMFHRIATISTANAVSRDSFIGWQAGETGTVNVTNARTWTISTGIRVGDEGTGYLNILGGSTVFVTNTAVIARTSTSTGQAVVNGTGSLWDIGDEMRVANNGDGTLRIEAGGKVTNSIGLIAASSSGNGSVTVTGAGSWWDNTGDLFVGNAGVGTLRAEAGGRVSSSYGYIAYNSASNGSVTVTGVDSLWDISFILRVGYSNTGTLTIANGGKVTASHTSLAITGTATGTLNLNGNTTNRGALETGYVSESSGSGGGKVNFNGGILRATANQTNFLRNFETGDLVLLANGGFIDTNGFNVTIAPGSGSTTNAFSGTGGLTKQGAGTLTLNTVNTFTGLTTIQAGRLVLNGSLAGSASVTGGTLHLNGSIAGSVTVAAGAFLTGTGPIGGTSTILGTHSPGNSPGISSHEDLSYGPGSNVIWELYGNTTSGRGTIFDGINVNDALSFTGTTLLDLVFNDTGSTVNWLDPFWDSSRLWLVYDVGGSTTGFGNLSVEVENWQDGAGNFFNTELPGSVFYTILDANGRDVWLIYAIPEPSRALLLLGGLLGMALRRRRGAIRESAVRVG